jgi:long-chain fatty acid transport protein
MILISLSLLLLFCPAVVFADGFRNPSQSAAAVAQGNAFAAQADDASAVFYNPAGMTQLRGVQQVAGVALVNVNTQFTGLNGQKQQTSSAALSVFLRRYNCS